jgi:hypothetical protein
VYLSLVDRAIFAVIHSKSPRIQPSDLNFESAMSLEELKSNVRTITKGYRDREERSRRMYLQEQAYCLRENRHKEFNIKSRISKHFGINYSSVSFCGSGQIGFSIHKDTLFTPTVSDLDVACISSDLFQRAWIDVVRTTNAFNDLTPFNQRDRNLIELFKEQILKRGMIIIEAMPRSALKIGWTQFQDSVGRDHKDLFAKITIAIYMNEYAFCWKQDSALSSLVGA